MDQRTTKAIFLIVAFTVAAIAVFLVVQPAIEANKAKDAADKEAERLRKIAETLQAATNRERAAYMAESETEAKKAVRDLLQSWEYSYYSRELSVTCDGLSGQSCKDRVNSTRSKGVFLKRAIDYLKAEKSELIPFGWEPYNEGNSLKWRNTFEIA